MKTAVLGAGIIGASWASLFLAAGHEVHVYDPSNDTRRFVSNYIRKAWPFLQALDLAPGGGPPHATFHTDAESAASQAGFIQESVPERLDVKLHLILGHPFNPPHLIPLVELLGNEQTADGVLAGAESFYRSCGKVTIRLRKEV